jgi:hypothetical protein
MMTSNIEIPFAKRHHCWFCGEPSSALFQFPHQYYLVIDCQHPTVSTPCCKECRQLANLAEANCIWAVNRAVKKALIHKYKKDLAIGINWTQEELANSEFESGNFAGFQKSAWLMYEIAKERVNYHPWTLVVNGLELAEEDLGENFIFDGMIYPSANEAISHYVYSFNLHEAYFKDVLACVGLERFSYAIRFCRLLVGANSVEKKAALKELQHD